MTTRKTKLSLLYIDVSPSRWLQAVTTAIDRNAAALCQGQWASAYVPAAVPARAWFRGRFR